MKERPAGFTIRDIDCIPVGKPGDRRFYALPGKPRVELDDDGRPRASLMMIDSGAAQVSVQAVWTVAAADLDDLRAEIPRHNPGDGEVTLEMAPLSDVTASLVVTGEGGETTFGPRPALGFDPQRVAFSETVPAAVVPDVARAFEHQPGHLSIRYSGQLELTEEVDLTIRGDVALDLKALAPQPPKSSGWSFFGPRDPPAPPAPPNRSECLEQVGRAIAAGRLQIDLRATPGASPALRQKVEARCREEVAGELARTLERFGAGARDLTEKSVQFQTKDTESNTYEIAGAIDLGEWLGTQAGA